MQEHTIYFKHNLPLIAIPINVSLKCSLKAINCLPSFTLNRKLFKIYLYLITPIFYFVNKIYPKPVNNEHLVELVNWANNFKNKHNKPLLYPIFIWSLVPNRKRYYIHFIDEKGNKIWFVKLTFNKDDFTFLNNEYHQLSNIQRIRKKSKLFSTPKIIDFGINKDSCFLATESLHKNNKLFHPSRNKFPEALSKEIQGTVMQVSQAYIFKLDWWIKFELRKHEFRELDFFIHKFSNNSLVDLSFVHGDFGSENILIDKNGFFIVIDWERATSNGPYYVDIIAYWLGQNHKMIKKNSKKAIKQFYKYFNKIEKVDLAFALCFLVAANFNLACIVAKQFIMTNEDII